MPTIDIGSVLNRAFEFYKQNISTLLITCLLGGIIAMAASDTASQCASAPPQLLPWPAVQP